MAMGTLETFIGFRGKSLCKTYLDSNKDFLMMNCCSIRALSRVAEVYFGSVFHRVDLI